MIFFGKIKQIAFLVMILVTSFHENEIFAAATVLQIKGSPVTPLLMNFFMPFVLAGGIRKVSGGNFTKAKIAKEYKNLFDAVVVVVWIVLMKKLVNQKLGLNNSYAKLNMLLPCIAGLVPYFLESKNRDMVLPLLGFVPKGKKEESTGSTGLQI